MLYVIFALHFLVTQSFIDFIYFLTYSHPFRNLNLLNSYVLSLCIIKILINSKQV